MRKILFALFLAMTCLVKSYGQEKEQNINFIISVDDKLTVGLIANIRMLVGSDEIEVKYIPGELSINNNDYEKIMSNKSSSFLLLFDYYDEYKNEKTKHYNYEIELKRAYYKQSYVVVRVYNLNKKKYKKIFYPLEGKNYTYELDLPSNSVLRVRKKR